MEKKYVLNFSYYGKRESYKIGSIGNKEALIKTLNIFDFFFREKYKKTRRIVEEAIYNEGKILYYENISGKVDIVIQKCTTILF